MNSNISKEQDKVDDHKLIDLLKSRNIERVIQSKKEQNSSFLSTSQLSPVNYFELKNSINQDTFHIGC